MKISKEFAELYGILLGDGCLSKYNRKDRKNPTYCTLFTGHTHDMPYYLNTLRPIMNKLYNVNGYIQKRKHMQCIVLVTTAKKVFDSLSSLGCPIGVKSDLKIPSQILNNNALAICCVRGIFDTDGSVYNRYSKQYSNHARHYHYKVVQIHMKEPLLIRQIKSILNNNGIRTTRIGSYNGAYVVRITEQIGVQRFFSVFNPSNKYHTERYLNVSGAPTSHGPIA
ncbi:LAGLIDADG family homing endonuclease [Candidatus Woesearchaeota archaeon]|nr:LAGLIDADG family homing endonuclease [Candidatus Woesearchaeota archaeon]